ncbi:MAG: hypothetical protein WAW42_10640 [Candidatus Competibacteraceae bacterium]
MLTGTTLGNANEAYTYNSFGEVATYHAAYSGTNRLDLAYTRDALGRITQKVETIQGQAATYDYAYDLAGRLIEVRHNGATVATYGYDANGNRTQVNGATVATHDEQDRLLTQDGATYSYTANGELKTKTVGGQTTSYDYDVLGNLRHVALPDGRTLDYLIDGQDRRIGKKVNGVLTQGFLYQSALQIAAELDGNHQIVSRFVYASDGNSPDVLIKGGQTYRLIKDHLGSPRLIINNATGAIEQRMDYDVWGRVILDTNPSQVGYASRTFFEAWTLVDKLLAFTDAGHDGTRCVPYGGMSRVGWAWPTFSILRRPRPGGPCPPYIAAASWYTSQ